MTFCVVVRSERAACCALLAAAAFFCWRGDARQSRDERARADVAAHADLRSLECGRMMRLTAKRVAIWPRPRADTVEM